MDAKPRLFSLDNHIYDKLAADEAATIALIAAITAESLELMLQTRILVDELAGAPADVREVAARIPHRPIPTAGLILDVSRLGMARFERPGPIEAILGKTKTENLRHARDALYSASSDDQRMGQRPQLARPDCDPCATPPRAAIRG